MAFRSLATSFDNDGGATMTATPSGVAANDILLGFFVQDSTGHASITPTGWTAQSVQEQSGPDGQTFDLYSKVATGSDSFSSSYVVDANSCRWTVGAWSGRDTAASIDFNTCQNNTSRTTPVTIQTSTSTSGTFGVTSVSGDDVIVFMQLDLTVDTNTWGFTGLSGYTEQLDVNNTWITTGVYTYDNVSGGGDGSLSATATRATGAGQTGWGTFVVALAASGGGGGGGTGRLVNGCLVNGLLIGYLA
jgi:hypothetical protein